MRRHSRVQLQVLRAHHLSALPTPAQGDRLPRPNLPTHCWPAVPLQHGNRPEDSRQAQHMHFRPNLPPQHHAATMASDMQLLTKVGEGYADKPALLRGTAATFIAASSRASLTRATTSASTYDCAVQSGSMSAASCSTSAAAPVSLPGMLQPPPLSQSRSSSSNSRRWANEDGGGSSHSSSNQRRTRGCTAASWPQHPITNADAHPRAF
jgi:hypothetical protein